VLELAQQIKKFIVIKKSTLKQKNNKLTQFKQRVLSIIKPHFQQDLKQAKKIKNAFLLYFDGYCGIDAIENTSDTFTMGVCKLEYKDNTLTIYLRKPELLIGKHGHTINALTNYLGCNITIVEVDLLK